MIYALRNSVVHYCQDACLHWRCDGLLLLSAHCCSAVQEDRLCSCETLALHTNDDWSWEITNDHDFVIICHINNALNDTIMNRNGMEWSGGGTCVSLRSLQSQAEKCRICPVISIPEFAPDFM
jgi:hypothetical protein